MNSIIEDRVSKIDSGSNGTFKALSFFTGAMGLDIGLEKAGIKTLLACETDKASRETIITNNPKIGLIGDIRNYTVEKIIEYANLDKNSGVDLIAGGPPCQAFSSAGKRLGLSDERGNVFLKFIDVIEQIRPRYVVIENVRGLLSSHFSIDLQAGDEKFLPNEIREVKGSTLYYIFNRLKNSGYQVSFNLYNSANFGTPQIRERVIIICTLDDRAVPYLEPTYSENGDNGFKKWTTLKDAIGDLPSEPKDYISFPERRLKYYRLLSEGQNWRNLTVDLQKEALGNSYYLGGGKTGFFRRLTWDRPSPTLVTHPAMPATDLCHPSEDRPLSVQEYKRIQEFPDEWKVSGKLLDQYKQIGNAVPVSVGLAIGIIIKKHFSKCVDASHLDFKYSRYLKTSDKEFIPDFVKRSNSFLDKKRLEQLPLF